MKELSEKEWIERRLSNLCASIGRCEHSIADPDTRNDLRLLVAEAKHRLQRYKSLDTLQKEIDSFLERRE